MEENKLDKTKKTFIEIAVNHLRMSETEAEAYFNREKSYMTNLFKDNANDLKIKRDRAKAEGKETKYFDEKFAWKNSVTSENLFVVFCSIAETGLSLNPELQELSIYTYKSNNLRLRINPRGFFAKLVQKGIVKNYFTDIVYVKEMQSSCYEKIYDKDGSIYVVKKSTYLETKDFENPYLMFVQINYKDKSSDVVEFHYNEMIKRKELADGQSKANYQPSSAGFQSLFETKLLSKAMKKFPRNILGDNLVQFLQDDEYEAETQEQQSDIEIADIEIEERECANELPEMPETDDFNKDDDGTIKF